MRADITDFGTLTIIPESKIESYALDQWQKENRNACTLEFYPGAGLNLLVLSPVPITWIERIIRKINVIIFRVKLSFYK